MSLHTSCCREADVEIRKLKEWYERLSSVFYDSICWGDLIFDNVSSKINLALKLDSFVLNYTFNSFSHHILLLLKLVFFKDWFITHGD